MTYWKWKRTDNVQPLAIQAQRRLLRVMTREGPIPFGASAVRRR